jgi:acetylornithine deacetylase/succinyl-diaminopimelate desuccinylase-like protein
MILALPFAIAASLFTPTLAEHPAVKRALASIDERREPLIAEWIRVTEIPSPSGQERQRAAYIRTELAKLGVTDIKTDALGNVSALRKGIESGPPIVLAAHMDTVFSMDTPIKVSRENGVLKAPGIGDDSVNVVALLETARALDRAGVALKRDVMFLFTVQEETRLNGMMHWMKHSGVTPASIVALDSRFGGLSYGAFRISRLQFFYTSPGGHTLVSRGKPNPAKAVAKAILDLYAIPLPEPSPGTGQSRLPVMNVGKIGGGTVPNAIPEEAWFTVDLRSLDSPTQDRLLTQVVATAEAAAKHEGVGFRLTKPDGDDVDYSRARPSAERLADPLVSTAKDVLEFVKANGGLPVEPVDGGATDANVGVGYGIPSIAIGAGRSRNGHTVNEQSDESAMVPGTRMIVLLTCALAGLAER